MTNFWLIDKHELMTAMCGDCTALCGDCTAAPAGRDTAVGGIVDLIGIYGRSISSSYHTCRTIVDFVRQQI